MFVHHLGIACRNIDETIEYLQNTYSVSSVSARIYDPNQKVDLAMVYFETGTPVELISGENVEQFIKRNIKIYHVCYEVEDIEKSIENFIQNGATLVSPPKKAILFQGRRVAFLSTPLGFIELLEK